MPRLGFSGSFCVSPRKFWAVRERRGPGRGGSGGRGGGSGGRGGSGGGWGQGKGGGQGAQVWPKQVWPNAVLAWCGIGPNRSDLFRPIWPKAVYPTAVLVQSGIGLKRFGLKRSLRVIRAATDADHGLTHHPQRAITCLQDRARCLKIVRRSFGSSVGSPFTLKSVVVQARASTGSSCWGTSRFTFSVHRTSGPVQGAIVNLRHSCNHSSEKSPHPMRIRRLTRGWLRRVLPSKPKWRISLSRDLFDGAVPHLMRGATKSTIRVAYHVEGQHKHIHLLQDTNSTHEEDVLRVVPGYLSQRGHQASTTHGRRAQTRARTQESWERRVTPLFGL